MSKHALEGARASRLMVSWAVATALSPFLGCAGPPSENYFCHEVSERVARSAKSAFAAANSGGPPKTIVLTSGSIPPAHVEMEDILKSYLDRAGIAWIEVDSLRNTDKPQSEWISVGGDTAITFDRRHFVLRLTVEGDGEERVVMWGYDCGPGCGGVRSSVRLLWGGDVWLP